MKMAIEEANKQGLNKTAQIVVPNLTLGMAEAGGPEAMEGVLGAVPWCWRVPGKFDYPKGQKFAEKFANTYESYPSSSAASAYTILYEYRDAVQRAGSAEGAKVVKALEGHKYTILKDEQVWREFDHQSVQTVYAVKCKPAEEVKADKFQQDYFEIIASKSGEEAFITHEEWKAAREKAGKPTQLERLPGE